ncbi:unnamed protein product [Thlaspi arvense]|uniref:CRM domain-containing protein n=1 Tax=Thlaspi arvense TaxID=13288 RepID=A0AAU9TAY0_THLAR|nr:unnamed protein product [Thlaspi arvense]
MPKPYQLGNFRGELKPRKEVLGKPLTRAEIRELLKPTVSNNRQVNLGRDGLTHNMLELIHTHWKRQPVCKVRCLGVPTVDMDNVCRCLEEKTGGKIIHRVGGVVYLFRGRNYDHRTRPQYPVMLWKPATPVYPKLIQEAPEGLTKAEADELREKGESLLPICKLVLKYGMSSNCIDVYPHGELVPCVLLSFDNEQILMWRGKDWKSMYPEAPTSSLADVGNGFKGPGGSNADCDKSDAKIVNASPKMTSLWRRAIETSKALLLEEINLGPDALLKKVEDFEGLSQATEHSYPAVVLSSEGLCNKDQRDQSDNDDVGDDDEEEDEHYLSHSLEEVEAAIPSGSLPVDLIAKLQNEQ